MTQLTFAALRAANVKRCHECFHPLPDWSPLEWAGAMAGEAGEAANLCKKVRRLEEVDPAKIGEEIADTIIYADLLAARLGINLEDAVRRKFNAVSRRRLCDLMI